MRIDYINLGETLIEFLKYYSDLDSTSYAIACALPGEDWNKVMNLYQV
jgi:hypothetical protein